MFELNRVVIFPITALKVSEIQYRPRDQEEGNSGSINESPTDDSRVMGGDRRGTRLDSDLRR